MTNTSDIIPPYHRAVSPFPRTLPDGKVATDELCHCGALRSQHNDRFAYGHGPCQPTNCAQYTWARTIYQTS